MPSKTTKSVKSAAVKSRKPAAKPAKAAASKTASKKSVSSLGAKAQILQQRTNFVAVAVVVAAALMALTAGFSSYNKTASVSNQTADKQGGLYLQALTTSGIKVGSTVSVALYENSGAESVNTVQSAIQYPADTLQVMAVKTGTAFPQEAATDTATPGLIRIARSVQSQSASVTGARPVATVQFKVLQAPTSTTRVGIDQSSSFLVRSSDNQNILHSSGTKSYLVQ